ncbi:fatty-acid peroxygenase [Pontibacter brevis]
MTNIPKEKTFDNSLQMLLEGYPFLQKRFRRFNSDIFETRLLFQKVACLHGPEGAALFYDPDRFKRHGAVPKPVQKTLTGVNAIHTLDDAAHRHRKTMFMTVMSQESIKRLLDLMAAQWKAHILKWETMDRVVLYDEAREIMCKGICDWASVPLKEKEVRKRADDFVARVDAFGAAGPRHLRGRFARIRSEKWIERIIKQIRNGKLQVQEGSPVHLITWHKDLSGELLDPHMAAVELINLIRPTVAISRYITFAALALHQYPVYRQRILAGEENYTELFVQEVRRFYPFAPFLGARARQNFEWQGYVFEKDQLVLLDVYGTLHDERLWERPTAFSPERFRYWEGSKFDFIPQGGGDYETGHRCAGEWITIEVMKQAVAFLTEAITYRVPNQDLHYSLRRMPTYPNSGFVMSNVRRTGSLPAAFASVPPAASHVAAASSQRCPFL